MKTTRTTARSAEVGRRRDDDDDYDDEPRRRPRKKRRKKKAAAGIPGLAMAAAILFLIWGGLGAIYTLYNIIALVGLLDLGVPATVVLNGLITVFVEGVFAGYLISSGLSILNGQPDNIQSIGIAVLSICIVCLILSVVSLALIAPRFMGEIVMIAILSVLVALSGRASKVAFPLSFLGIRTGGAVVVSQG